MHRILLARPDDYEGWRDAARALALAGIAPDAIGWQVEGEAGDLFGDGGNDAVPPPVGPARRRR